MKKVLISIIVVLMVTTGCTTGPTDTADSSNEIPIAYIDSASPSQAVLGETVTLTGHGTDPDGSITAYKWRSSLDGDLGTTANVQTSTLSTGLHTIYLQVQDDKGAWSNEVSITVEITGTGVPSSGYPDLVVTDVYKVETENGYIIGYTLENQGSVDAAATVSRLYVEGVEKTGDTVPALSAGFSTQRHFVGWIYNPTTPVIKVVADADSNVTESNETNNEKQVTMAVEVVYDFVDSASYANWKSGPPVTSLTFGIDLTDTKGYATIRNDTKLEDGTGPMKFLETRPKDVNDGWVRGSYAEMYHQGYTVKAGEHFIARLGFAQGASAGNVTFFVVIAPEVGDNVTIAQVSKSYGTPFEEIDIPLTDFVGERSNITLEVRANGSSLEDRAVWIEAKIIR